MKAEILKILRDSNGHVSGQELCRKLGVSRTAVWKNIQQLKEEGYQIEAIQNKGYRIVDAPMDILNASEIKSRIRDEEIGSRIYFKEETDSTNTWAKRLAEEGEVSGTLVCADMQTSGKGRRGRSWSSPKGSSLYFSLLLRPDILPSRASALTLVMGMSVVQALENFLNKPVQIKWPNDVVVSGKKICGILTEMNAQIDYIEYLVIGVGINVNLTEFPREIADTATSVALEAGTVVSRAELAAEVIHCFTKNYGIFLKTSDMTGLKETYNSMLVNRDHEVRVLGAENGFTGVAMGINEKGELLVKKADGEIVEVFAGEVSVRGVYGYV